MDLKKHTAVLMNGVIVVVPVLVTVYVVVAAVFWLDALVLVRLPALFDRQFAGIESAGQIPWYMHGVGLIAAIIALYAIGLLARNWLFGKAFAVAEWIVERIPLVKSVYTAVRDMLQLFSTDEKKSGGQPVAFQLEEGKTQMLGMVMRQDASELVEADDDRVAVYLPMSYQIGGFTVFVPRDRVRPLEDMSVERLLKVAMTGGAGMERTPAGSPGRSRRPRQTNDVSPTSTQQEQEDRLDGTE